MGIEVNIDMHEDTVAAYAGDSFWRATLLFPSLRALILIMPSFDGAKALASSHPELCAPQSGTGLDCRLAFFSWDNGYVFVDPLTFAQAQTGEPLHCYLARGYRHKQSSPVPVQASRIQQGDIHP